MKGHLVLLMAPSGSGKKAVIDGLGDVVDKLYFAKTFTSRERRLDAEENPQYEFVSAESFQEMIDTDALIEWANYSENFYGTPKAEVISALQEKQVVFKEMELQGVRQIKELVPADAVTVVYIDAGPWEALEERILARSEISVEELQMRKDRYAIETKSKDEADVIIQNRNGELDLAQKKFRDVITDTLERLNI